jgi:prefoldin alpha subunit
LSWEKKKLASKSEEEFRRLNMELRLLEQTAEALQSRMNMINSAVADLTYAQMTLGGLEKENEKSELLVPIGGTSYIRAKLDNPDKIIVGMGAGVSVEKTRQEAEEIIKKRQQDLDKAKTSVQQQFAQVAEKINQDRERIEALVAAAREGKTQQDV